MLTPISIARSGFIASGQVGWPHLASGAVRSGDLGITAGTPNGTLFLRDDFAWAAAGGGLASGNVGSGFLASGSVQGFFGATRDIASGTVGVFDFGSGAVIAGTVGSGAIQSGNIASGQVGPNSLASGILTSGNQIGSGAIYGQAAGGIFTIASGSISNNELSSGSVRGGVGATPRHILSGTIGRSDYGSGTIVGHVAAGGSVIDHIASGTLDAFNMASGFLTSGVWVGSGTIMGQAGGGPFMVASGTLDNFDLASGLITSGVYIGSGAILGQAGGGPFNIASGTIGTFDIGSGAVRSGHIASGQVANFAVGSGAITSGRIGMGGTPTGTNFFRDDFTWASPGAASVSSGAVTQITFASGAGPEYLMPFVSGLTNPFTLITQETISGVRAVNVSQSGHIQIAMAGTSGRMPAVGIVLDNVASGIQCNVYSFGDFQLSSGMADYSGWVGTQLFVGRSGQIVSVSGSWNSGGLLSGDVTQAIGVPLNSGAFQIGIATNLPIVLGLISSGMLASGNISEFDIASGAINSGQIASGAVQGFFGATRNIASGTVGVFDLGSGAVIAGTVGSGAVVSGNIASGQIGHFAVAANAITSGQIGSGAAMGQQGGGPFNIASGTLGKFDLSSGILTSGVYIGSGAILGQKAGGPFTIASGSIGTNDIGSGQVQSGNILSGNIAFWHHSSGSVQGFIPGGVRHILSGSIGDFDLASGQVIGHVLVLGANSTNHIASGTLDGYNFASGALADWSQYLLANVSGLNNFLPVAITQETVSGVRAVNLTASGHLQVAMASVASRMPACGVVVENVASGIPANVFLFGQFQFSSGLADYSGYVGLPLFVGRSGQVVSVSGSFNSGGLLSGDTYQPIGFALSSGAAMLQVDAPSISGGPPVVASGGIQSGMVASGAVQGFFGATRDIASGTVGVFDFGSGAVVAGTVGSGAIVSGNIASGQIGNAAFASGSITSGVEIGSGAIWGRAGVNQFMIASGTIANFDIASGGVLSGNIASGQIGQKHLSSGIITSGVYIGSGTILGQQGGGPFNIASGTLGKFDLSSGIITSGVYVGSGTILGQAGGGPFNIASGTITSPDIGSGAILSGHIASGQVANFAVGSGAITSGRIAMGGTPNGTLFFRDDYTWQTAGGGSLTSGGLVQIDFGSGVGSEFVKPFVSGLTVPYTVITEEIVSGVRAVNISASGNLRVAMASVAARMPAVGVVFDNVASGLQCTVYSVGDFQVSSGLADYSGYLGTLLFVGRSGQLVSVSGSFNSGGLLSGDITQPVGVAINSGGPNINMSILPPFVPSLIYSGSIGSGQITGTHLASGAITSGVWIGSGALWGSQGPTALIASGTLGKFDLSSGILTSGVYIGSGTILGAQGGGPRNIASGTVGNFDLSSGIITSGVYVGSGTIMGHAGGGPFQIVSGSITTADIGSGAILSGQIGSGQVGQFAISSGAIQQNAYSSGTGPSYLLNFTSGENLNNIITQETISGVRAVCVSTSGHLAIAMASQSGRMPSVGVVFDNVASGIQANVFLEGTFTTTSGLSDFSGYLGQTLWVGRSGQVVTVSGSWNSGGLLSGDVWQPLGTVALTSGGLDLGVGATVNFTVGQITSGNIASGQIGSTHIASGGVLSGNIGSGQIGTYAHASGTTVTDVMNVTPLWSGAFYGAYTCSEPVSGIRAVCIDRSNSGAVRIAMSAVSGRMPAIGVVADNVLSGIPVNVISHGALVINSGYLASGFIMGRRVWLSRSGHIATLSGAFFSGGFASGDIAQCLGTLCQVSSGQTSGLVALNIDPLTSPIFGSSGLGVLGFAF